MKHTKDKAFTIVELVIVIAVIGILSTILIPVFARLLSNAKESAKQANLKNAYLEYCSKNANLEQFYAQNDIFFAIDGQIYKFNNEKYIKISLTGDEYLTEDNATESGYKKLNEKYNNLNSYVLDNNTNSESTSQEDNNENGESENLSELLHQVWEIYSSLHPEAFYDNTLIAKHLDGDNYIFYMSNNEDFSEIDEKTEWTTIDDVKSEYDDLSNSPIESNINGYEVWSLVVYTD